MDDEINAMHTNRVWQLRDKNERQLMNYSTVGCRWVYSVKEKNGKKVHRAHLAKKFSSEGNVEENVYILQWRNIRR